MKNKQPFTPRDLINSRYLEVMTSVADLFKDPIVRDRIVLEDLGSWLEQSSWTDKSGFYMTIRLAPLYKHLPDTQAAGRQLALDFLTSRTDTRLEPAVAQIAGQADRLNGGEPVTYVIETDTYHIGD
jgi:hypothetical protein